MMRRNSSTSGESDVSIGLAWWIAIVLAIVLLAG